MLQNRKQVIALVLLAILFVSLIMILTAEFEQIMDDVSADAGTVVPIEIVIETLPVAEKAEVPEAVAKGKRLLSDEELDTLARCVEAEAGNQDIVGKRLVVDVILNRVDDACWPDTIYEVVSKPYEFSTYWNGTMDTVVPTEETYEAIRMELETRSYPGLFYFTAYEYSEYGTPWKQVGDHYFSTK